MQKTYPICQEAVEFVKKFEGLHDGDLREVGLRPKQDPVGIWTIGYGHAQRDRETGRLLRGESDRNAAYRDARKLTVEEALALLKQDLDEYATHVAALIAVPVTESEFGALVSFAFNVGISNFKGSTLLRLLNQGRHEQAAAEFPKWCRAGGRIMPGLVKRREAEKELFLRGRA